MINRADLDLDTLSGDKGLHSKFGKINFGFALNMACHIMEEEGLPPQLMTLSIAVLQAAKELEAAGLDLQECLNLAKEDHQKRLRGGELNLPWPTH